MVKRYNMNMSERLNASSDAEQPKTQEYGDGGYQISRSTDPATPEKINQLNLGPVSREHPMSPEEYAMSLPDRWSGTTDNQPDYD